MTLAACLLATALLCVIGAHVALVAGIVARAWWKAPLTMVIPPLAPYWGWQLGMRRRVAVWWIAVIAYAVGITLLAR